MQILRDLDLLTELAKHNLVHVRRQSATLSKSLKKQLEPRTASPSARLRIIRDLSKAGA